ncbi:MFS transporter [Algibacillus agarilyticus]|uniref:MFS transporter n=1 Tax=Algibacillus agarilyticus TaxID=2234133 RepID=UPI000DD0E53F|nr:MFS transporter [Algibacillus agarilyticus]
MPITPVSRTATAALGIGQVSSFFVNNGIWILALPFYQMTLGLDPFLLSLASAIPVLIATFIGPWVGNVVDRYKHRHGTRKPFIVGAGAICSVLFGSVWMVPIDWPSNWQFAYLFIIALTFYISSTFYTIPMTCLQYEISTETRQRTKVIAITAVFSKLCAIANQWAFPISQLAIFSSAVAGVQFVGWFIALVLIALCGLAPVIGVKESPNTVKYEKIESSSLSKNMLRTLKNKQFLVILGISFFVMAGIYYSASVDYYLIVYYMCNGDIAEGSIWKGVLSTSFAIMGIASIPLIVKLSSHVGIPKALQIIFLLNALGGLIKWFLFVPEVRWLISLDALFCCLVWSAMGVLIPSLIAKICDEEQSKNNEDNKGLFISVQAWVLHVSSSLAIIASGYTLNLIGFDANLGAEQTEFSLQAMRYILSGGTILFSLLAWGLLTASKLSSSNT